jgi:hypothetical protein
MGASKILRPETGLLCDARQHSRANLFAIVEREHDVGPAFTLERSMRSALPLDRPADAQQYRKHARRSR